MTIQSLMMTHHTLVTTLIPAASGTVITDSNNTGWVRAGAAFDGTTSQAQTVGAVGANNGVSTNGLTYYIGKNWGAGVNHRVTKLVVYGPSDTGVLVIVGGTILLDGSNDGSSWTTLDSFAGSASSAAVLTRTGTITATTPYQYHRISTLGNGANGIAVAEVQFYEDL